MTGLTPWLKVLSILLILAWAPIIIRFFRQFYQRRNAISLAICFFVVIVAYGDFLVFAIHSGFNVHAARLAWLVVQSVGCVFFYLSFWWSDSRFRDTRKAPPTKKN